MMSSRFMASEAVGVTNPTDTTGRARNYAALMGQGLSVARCVHHCTSGNCPYSKNNLSHCCLSSKCYSGSLAAFINFSLASMRLRIRFNSSGRQQYSSKLHSAGRMSESSPAVNCIISSLKSISSNTSMVICSRVSQFRCINYSTRIRTSDSRRMRSSSNCNRSNSIWYKKLQSSLRGLSPIGTTTRP